MSNFEYGISLLRIWNLERAFWDFVQQRDYFNVMSKCFEIQNLIAKTDKFRLDETRSKDIETA